MSKNKNLLNENTIRRMMKLASVDSLSDSFISTKYSPLAESVEEENIEEAKHEKEEEKPVKESEEVVAEEEMDLEMEEPEMEEPEMEEPEMEMTDADEPDEEDEVTLTDDEARDIIALADKLRAAMGGEEESAPEGEEMSMDMGDDEMEMDAEVEEEPGMRYDMMEEEEENLYEAALSNLDIEVIEEKEVQLENLKKEIYKKVVNRLLKESKK
jgi:hypothetical protein